MSSQLLWLYMALVAILALPVLASWYAQLGWLLRTCFAVQNLYGRDAACRVQRQHGTAVRAHELAPIPASDDTPPPIFCPCTEPLRARLRRAFERLPCGFQPAAAISATRAGLFLVAVEDREAHQVERPINPSPTGANVT